MENIVISHPERLEELKAALKNGGLEGLHVLADFEKTLTSASREGNPTSSLIGILSEEKCLTPDYAREADILFRKYLPIERDPKIPVEEKKQAMEEWWRIHFELLIKTGITKDHLRKVAQSKRIRLREGCGEFLDLLNQYHIPLVILSASGLGNDVIPMLLEQEGKLYGNIHIISNAFIWDENGKANGVKQPVIHSLNKDETVLRELPFYHEIAARKNVLLLGDNLHDIDMARGFPYKHLVKIGFLNEGVKENLEYYQQEYDVVILNDGSMEYVNELVREIAG